MYNIDKAYYKNGWVLTIFGLISCWINFSWILTLCSIGTIWCKIVMDPSQATAKCLISTTQSVSKVLKVLAWFRDLKSREDSREKNEEGTTYLTPHHTFQHSQIVKEETPCSEVTHALLTPVTYPDIFLKNKSHYKSMFGTSPSIITLILFCL